MTTNQAEYDALVGTSSTAKKTASESESDETIASTTDIKAKNIFDTFMKRWQTDVLSGLSDEQLRTYVSNFTVNDMKDWFMHDGKKWKLIGPASTRKARKVKAVFEIMEEKGMATLKKLVDEIIQQRVVGMGIIRRKSKANAKAKAKSRTNKREMAYTPQPTIPQTMPPTGLQPQQYRQQLTATTITPQLTQQLAQQVAEQIKQQQSAAQPVVAPAATGSGKLRKSITKAKARLKPIKENEITVIKPPKMNLDYIDLSNDPYLINRIH